MEQITSIKVNANRRVLGDISELAKSINDIGLLNPISITRDLVLIAGLHRLEACKSLGWTEIPATVLDVDDITTQLAEIDENLVRNELSALERGEQLAKRKDLYEAKYPQTKKGQSQALGMNKAQKNNVGADSALTFAKDVSLKTKQAERTIQEDVQIAKRISEPVRNIIRDTPLADNKTELLNLSRFDIDTQSKVAENIASGQASTVSQAINNLYPSAKQVVREDTSLKWIQRFIDALDPAKVMKEKGGILEVTKSWSTGSKETLLAQLGFLTKTYGELLAVLGEQINDKTETD